MSDHVKQYQTTQLKQHRMPFNIDGKTSYIEFITTEHGDTLCFGIEYVTAITGCARKDASNKLSSLYNAIPLLRPPTHDLRYYSKVIVCIFNNI